MNIPKEILDWRERHKKYKDQIERLKKERAHVQTVLDKNKANIDKLDVEIEHTIFLSRQIQKELDRLKDKSGIE